MNLSADTMEGLFDALPDVVFFVKDQLGRYTHVNLTLVKRLGLKRRDQVIGRSVDALFPPALGHTFAQQDQQVLAGERIDNQLEVHVFPNRAPGWCLTRKLPVEQRGRIVGLIGISRDLGLPDIRHPVYARLRKANDHLQQHYGEKIRVQNLADLSGMSVAQLERHFRRVFQLTPQQVLARYRIEAAMQLLREPGSVADIGMACGFTDQSAFARQFKATVGMTPRDYRQLLLSSPSHAAGQGATEAS
ncbi:helix-turn-helix domain-containing protein [Frateuria aurantia]